MTATVQKFRERATIALADVQLQTALDGATGRFASAREKALAALPWADALRDHFKQMRAATLANLAEHLQSFERNATTAGAQVHWAEDGAAACAIVTDIARRRGVSLVTKSKSMATEEIHLNAALAEAGVRPVETDLGEWIVQLAGEPPSHIIAPAIHKTKEQVADLFAQESGVPQEADIPALTAEARRMLRAQFLAAGMGISGGNLMVAETGSVVLVTNEGNGRMVTTAPPIHVAVIGLEKIAPTWNDAAVWLSLLARSATGQPMSIYTTVVTGPKRAEDPDGPEEVHIILLDNGRSHLVGSKYEEILQCIRCGACLNVCPVYREAGGHAYGSPYSGPIGAVISPLLFGLDKYPALPHASSLCGACKDVCPARIDLPRMLLELRADLVAQGLSPAKEGALEKAAAFALRYDKLWRVVTGLGRSGQRPLLKNGKLQVPDSFNPAGERQLPALAKKSFHDLWRDGEV